MASFEFRSLVNHLPLPLLLLDDAGTLLAASRQAMAMLGGLEHWVGQPLDAAVDNAAVWRQRLAECRLVSGTVPARIAWQAGGEAATAHAQVHFAPPCRGAPGWFIVALRPQAEAAARFVGLREQLERLDAEISRRDRAEEALRDREAWLRVVLNSIADAVVTTDVSANVTWMNPAAETLTGWTIEQARGKPIDVVMDLVHEESLKACPNPVLVAMRERKPTGMLDDTVLLQRNGTAIAVEDTAAPIFDDRSRLAGGVIVFHDVTEKRRLVREMAERATHDALTGLCNRFEFDARLAESLAVAKSQGLVHGLMYIDLDHFKVVNDTSGHPVGDALLQDIAAMLLGAVRTTDLVARLGGDEFGILLPRCGLDAAQRIADDIHERFANFRFDHEGRRFRIGASIGLVLIDDHWPDCAALMQAADTACYAAKEEGGHRTCLWQEGGELAEARGRMAWVQRLSDALEEQRFELHLQRVERLRDERGPVHAEALIRLRDTDGRLVSPGEFLPAAERFRLATAVDRWVLKSVLAALRADPRAAVKVAINFSGQSVGDRAFRDEVMGLLGEFGAGCTERLCVEVTETAAVSHLADAGRFMGQLRDLGVEVALDDFGAGSSSFGYLRHLPVDWLKIDGQFVEGLPDDRLGATAVRCFVDAARVVGARSIAERVENAAVLETLRMLGVDMAQGYHLHRPSPWSEVWATLPRVPALRGLG